MSLVLPWGAGCDEQRQKECQALEAAMKPLEAPGGDARVVPALGTVRGVKAQVEGTSLHDQPLHIYAENYVKTLAILGSAIEVQASSLPPDGADDLIRKSLKDARDDADDVRRYCAQ